MAAELLRWQNSTTMPRLRRTSFGVGAPHRRRALCPGLLRDSVPQTMLPRYPALRDTRDDTEDQDAAERSERGGSGRRGRPAVQRPGDFSQRYGEGRGEGSPFGQRSSTEERLRRDERLRTAGRGSSGAAGDGQGQEAAADGAASGHQHLTNILPGAAVRATVARWERLRRGFAGAMRAGGARPHGGARRAQEGAATALAQRTHRIHLIVANMHGLLPIASFVC